MDGRRGSSPLGRYALLVIAALCLLSAATVYGTINETKYECAKKHFWNDDTLQTFTFHLRITGEGEKTDIRLHAKQNPLDEGMVVGDAKMYPLDHVYLHVPLIENSPVVDVYLLQPDRRTVIQMQFAYDKNGLFNKTTVSGNWNFASAVDNFHAALRLSSDGKILYDRRECVGIAVQEPPLYTFCDEHKCKVGSGKNCISDSLPEWRYTVPEKLRSDLDDFVVSTGCNLVSQRLLSAKNASEMFVYRMALKDDKMDISLENMPKAACYEIDGYQAQVIGRNWDLSANSICREFPIEQYPPIPREPVLVYIGIFAGVIVALIVLCGLYVYFCSDDEIDEHLPPPGAVPPMAGVTTSADATPPAAGTPAVASAPPASAPAAGGAKPASAP